MKALFAIYIGVFLSVLASCKSQKIVQQINDAHRLVEQQERFIGKPLKILLGQIRPKVKSAIGNPNEILSENAPVIILYFVDKQEFLERERRRQKPTRIGIHVGPLKGRKYPPLSGDQPWTKEQEDTYGDMTVLLIWVRGEN